MSFDGCSHSHFHSRTTHNRYGLFDLQFGAGRNGSTQNVCSATRMGHVGEKKSLHGCRRADEAHVPSRELLEEAQGRCGYNGEGLRRLEETGH